MTNPSGSLERATLTNMATECSAKTAIVIADDETWRWLAEWRPGVDVERLKARAVAPDESAEYAGGIHAIDLASLRPMVAHPGDPDHGVPSDPTNGAWVDEIGDVKIDIAYGGSCTAGNSIRWRHVRACSSVPSSAMARPRPGR